MSVTTTNTPRVYVGTYGKYNEGSIKGKWLDLDDYASKDDFYEACKELHKDEADPELMFQDFEGIPEGLIGESWIDDAVWEWLELDDDDRELLAVYQEGIDQDGDIERARDAFMGKFDSEEDWAAQYWDDSGVLNEIPENLRYYIDYEAFARDRRLEGSTSFITHGGRVWVFSNC